jgi:uncharacterized protein (DUF427 family)
VASEITTICPWKGVAHYHHVVLHGEVTGAAWSYPTPNQPAR